MFYKNDFANIIKNISNNFNNQREFASESKINRNYLSRYMNLKMDKPPKPSILLKLSKASHGKHSYIKLMQICGYINYKGGNNMRILSQDKKVLVNFNNIVSIWINSPLENNEGKFEIKAESDGMHEILGVYDTEERAKKIIQDICYNDSFNNQYNMPEK